MIKGIERVDAPVYVVSYNGNKFRCFSRNTAIKRLSHYMTRRMFDRAGIETRPITRIDRDDTNILWINKPIKRYWNAQERCHRRLRKLISSR